jgi:tRNA (guanine-N7-)-methyltransferase
MTAAPPSLQRRIKSFVLRQGRMTESQEKAFTDLASFYLLDSKNNSFTESFDVNRPIYLEIGFGMGDSLISMAALHPEVQWLGIEVHRPGVGRALQLIHKQGLKNVRLIQDDAVEVLKNFIPDHFLSQVCLFFPDPWPKKRHHKRRIVQPEFLALLAQKLQKGGLFHLATDWQNYAEHMQATLETSPHFENVAGPYQYSSAGERPLTKFENRGLNLGHSIFDLLYRNCLNT